MKTILFSISLLACTFASCSKCYNCRTSTSEIEVCKNTDLYNNVDQHLSIYDDNGEMYSCE